MKNICFRTIMLKGEAGGTIDRIEKTSSSLNVDTYTIYLNDGTTSTFEVTNGTSIESIEKTATAGYIDTYTITLTDGSTQTFEVENGKDGAPGYEVPAGAVVYFDSSDAIPEGYEASANPDASAFSKPLTVDTATSASFTPAASSSGNVTIDVSKSGYTAIGIVGITGTNTSVLSFSDFYLESATSAKVYYYNNSSAGTQLSTTISVKVLYVKY